MNLLFWKHKKAGHVIKQECYDKLPAKAQTDYYKTAGELPTHKVESANNDDGFVVSMMAAETSDSAALGMAVGGNIAGAMIGEAIAESNHDEMKSDGFDGYGGGDFGGGGSSGDWGASTSSDYGSLYDSSSGYDTGNSSFDSSSF